MPLTPSAVVRIGLSLGVSVAASVLLVAPSHSQGTGEPSLAATPQAHCNSDSRPEPGLQGRVPQADYDSGRALKGYTCNARKISHFGHSGGFKVQRYVDTAGHVCAYYDSTLMFPTDVPYNVGSEGIGTYVLDLTDPRRPVKTANLETFGMDSPHESLLLNQTRGIIAAVSGNLQTEPGILDLYDVSQDCRTPVLQSSTPLGILGHESGFAPDGNTFYATSTFGQTLTAVDVSDPTLPVVLATKAGVNFHGVRLSDDGKTLYAADINNPSGPDSTYANGGLQILDVSQVQERATAPQMPVISALTWRSGSIPQAAEPITIHGHPYLLEIDEFANFSPAIVQGGGYEKTAPVGAARIIDIADPTEPKVISNLRLKAQSAKNRLGPEGDDPGASSITQGYTGHYCSTPRRADPGIVACSMILSGLRIFDISDPYQPREVGYFNKPSSGGATALSAPAWDLAHRMVWYTDGSRGFFAVRLAKSIVPAHYWK